MVRSDEDNIGLRRDIIVGLALLAVVFLSKLITLNVPYHWDEMGAYIPPAHWLAEGSLIKAIPGFYPAEKFFGHPTGLYFSLAVIYKVFGEAIWISHLFIITFAYLGVLYTYLLGRMIFNRIVGVIAAVFLFGSPLYFAQSGLVLGDIPITAFGVMSVYYGLKGRYAAYLICSVYMVMLKETSIAIVAAMMIYLFIVERGKSGTWVKILKYSVPGFVLAAFFILQKIETGHFLCNPYFKSTPAMSLSFNDIIHQGSWVLNWTLLMQYRWILTLITIVSLIIYRKAAWKKEYGLFLLIMIFFVGAFSLIFFMTRYIQSILPYLSIMGAAAFVSLIKNDKLKVLFVIVVLVFFGLKYYPDDRDYHCYDDSMQYTQMVKVNLDACRYIEKEHAGRSVLTVWPVSQALQEPYQGYVKNPVKVVSFDEDYDLLVYFHNPGCDSDKLLKLIEQDMLVLAKRFDVEGKIVEVYQKK